MKRPTLRSATNPTTRLRRQPISPNEMAPTLPCLQWRPRSVDHYSASPGLGRGLREQRMGVVLQWVGFTHTVGAFSVIPGMGMGWVDTSSSKRWHCFSHRAHSWSCPTPSVLPVLTCCAKNKTKKPFTKPQSWLAINILGTQAGIAGPNISFYTELWTSLALLMWPKERFEFAWNRDGCCYRLALPCSSVFWEENLNLTEFKTKKRKSPINWILRT